jgi:hypothetical protein
MKGTVAREFWPLVFLNESTPYRPLSSNVNNIEMKRREALIMGIFAKLKRNDPVK